MTLQTILLLEDDADRICGFESAVAQLGPGWELRVWRDARRMISECHKFLADAALISLDHDLNREQPDSPDPGDGVDVAEFLARLPQVCPAILHTSNADGYWSMHNEFRFGGWQVERVVPLGTDWIEQSWLPTARALLDQARAGSNRFYRPSKTHDQRERLSRAVLSLYGLAMGDGIGDIMFGRPERAQSLIMQDDLPAGPWLHTDDTEMAISIVEVLRLLGAIHQESLANLRGVMSVIRTEATAAGRASSLGC